MKNFITILVVLAVTVLFADYLQQYGYTKYSEIAYHPVTGDQINIREHPVTFYIALQPQNVDVLEKTILRISDPDDPEYGSWLTIDEIDQLTGAKMDYKRLVNGWLITNGVTNQYQTWYADAVVCRAPAYLVEKLFKISFNQLYCHRNSNVTYLSTTDDYHIPESLRGIIIFVEGLVIKSDQQIGGRRRRKRSVDNSVDIDTDNEIILIDWTDTTNDPGMVTREVFQRVYHIPNGDLSASTSIGAMEYQGNDGYSQQDLVTSQKANGLDANPVSKNHIIGHVGYPDTESQLDIQMIGQLAPAATLWYEVANGWMYQWAVNFYNRQNIPYIVSLSWGWSEIGQCTIVVCGNQSSHDYVHRTNFEFMKLAARGVTVVVASGDAGSPGRTNEACDTSSSEHFMNPVFPGSSKWVTSVGATYLVDSDWTNNHKIYRYDRRNYNHWKTPICQHQQCATGNEEREVSRAGGVFWTSGAGFDRWQTTPAWQAEQVLNYLNSGVNLPPQQYWNRYGRAYPDVSAIGHNCLVHNGGNWEPVDGTSCSAPVFASILAILNDYLVKAGGSRIGFANPLLYKMAKTNLASFNDITIGNSSCTEYGCCGSEFGFLAGPGWDAVSGLGTPNVAEMIKYINNIF